MVIEKPRYHTKLSGSLLVSFHRVEEEDDEDDEDDDDQNQDDDGDDEDEEVTVEMLDDDDDATANAAVDPSYGDSKCTGKTKIRSTENTL